MGAIQWAFTEFVWWKKFKIILLFRAQLIYKEGWTINSKNCESLPHQLHQKLVKNFSAPLKRKFCFIMTIKLVSNRMVNNLFDDFHLLPQTSHSSELAPLNFNWFPKMIKVNAVKKYKGETTPINKNVLTHNFLNTPSI